MVTDTFDIMDFKAALNQQAFLHYQQLGNYASTSLPQHQDKFTTSLLTHAVTMNQDPANLETLVHMAGQKVTHKIPPMPLVMSEARAE
jgi:hypothetical protein